MAAPATTLDCPACGYRQNAVNPRCLRCQAQLTAPTAPVGPATLSREAWRALAIGLVLAAALTAVPLFQTLFSPLITIVHELGHAAVAWCFGYPAVPAFDFSYGGGVTAIEEERRPLVLGGAYLALAWAGWRVRRHVPTLLAWAELVAGFSWLAFTDWHEVVILGMGHGTELVIAGIFLYRALSGDAVLRVDERPAYAMAAFLILIHDITFAWGLATSDFDRALYEDAKGGGAWMDFSQIGIYLSAELSTVAAGLLWASPAPVVAAWLAHRYQDRLARWWDAALRT